MANEQNLKPFKPGPDERRNLNGRPKLLPELEHLLADVLGVDEGSKDLGAGREILEALLKKAKKGDVRAAEIILDRAYGKPLQRTQNENRHLFADNEPEHLTPDKIAEIERIVGDGKRDIEAGTVPGKRKGQG